MQKETQKTNTTEKGRITSSCQHSNHELETFNLSQEIWYKGLMSRCSFRRLEGRLGEISDNNARSQSVSSFQVFSLIWSLLVYLGKQFQNVLIFLIL